MNTTTSIKKTKELINRAKKKNKRISFVPTMGALHQGHLSLIEKAKKESDYLVVSIFINPLQFGPAEDLKNYPRNPKNDKKMLKKYGADLVFQPQINKMYGPKFSTYVAETQLSQILCGKSRPGHFRGVCTVIVKLFNIVCPDLAYFGQKDYQQALIIKKIVENLNFSVKVKLAPIFREKDKLALSSRNLYLNKNERKESKSLYQALLLAKEMIRAGEKDPKRTARKAKKVIEANSTATVDYFEIRRANDLEKIKKIEGRVFIGAAAYFGKTRLIDNIIIQA